MARRRNKRPDSTRRRLFAERLERLRREARAEWARAAAALRQADREEGANANAAACAIEQEILRLVTEIEGLKGRLRKLETDRRFARGEIFLSFQEQTLPEDIPSSFDWINSVDFYRFIEEDF